jgi:hypothetical protein
VSSQALARDRWLARPITYTVCTPLLTIAGAATTIAAPILLDATSFGQFALLISIFQYGTDFDLGLARLADRLLHRSDIDVVATLESILLGRLAVAGGLAIVVSILGVFYGLLAILSGLAGIAVMLTNGPITVYRARSQIAQFTSASLLLQFGLSLPRFIGLMLGGISGCVIAMLGWFSMTALVVNAPLLHRSVLHRFHWQQLRQLFTQSLPLFVLSSAWAVYLLANRWMSFVISATPADAGLFAFGANLMLVGLGVVSLVAQTYYPRHLVNRNRTALYNELVVLAVLALVGCLIVDLMCRFALDWMFPHFIGAEAATAATCFSGIPFGLCAWLIPMVIALTGRPLREGLLVFGLCLIALYGCMHWGNGIAGIDGQAWGSVPATMLLLGFLLHLVVRGRLLRVSSAIFVWSLVACMEGICAGAWHFTFQT